MKSAVKGLVFLFIFILKIRPVIGHSIQKKNDDCTIRLCDNSPILKYQITPELTTPLKLYIGDVYNISYWGVMPHAFFGGFVNLHMNVWPFEGQLRVSCLNGHHEHDKTNGICYATKGDKVHDFKQFQIDEKIMVPLTGHYIGNVSLVNQDDELMVCFFFDCHVVRGTMV